MYSRHRPICLSGTRPILHYYHPPICMHMYVHTYTHTHTNACMHTHHTQINYDMHGSLTLLYGSLTLPFTSVEAPHPTKYPLPVRAKYNPTYPFKWGRKKDPPTSGKRPMAVSGIANSVFSVATLNGACTDIPTPWEEEKGRKRRERGGKERVGGGISSTECSFYLDSLHH